MKKKIILIFTYILTLSYFICIAKNFILINQYSVSKNYYEPSFKHISSKYDQVWKKFSSETIDQIVYSNINFLKFNSDSTGILGKTYCDRIFDITAYEFEFNSLLPFDYKNQIIHIEEFKYDSTHLEIDDKYIYYKFNDERLYLSYRLEGRGIRNDFENFNDNIWHQISVWDMLPELLNPFLGYEY